MVASSVSHGMVGTVVALAAGSINAVSKVAMVPTKQLAIARIRGRDIRRVWALPAVPHGLRLRNPF